MCQHDEEGAMGIIINKPMHAENIDEIMQQTELGQINPTPEVYFGGPVNLEMGLFLHDTSYEIDGTLSVSKSIAFIYYCMGSHTRVRAAEIATPVLKQPHNKNNKSINMYIYSYSKNNK